MLAFRLGRPHMGRSGNLPRLLTATFCGEHGHLLDHLREQFLHEPPFRLVRVFPLAPRLRGEPVKLDAESPQTYEAGVCDGSPAVAGVDAAELSEVGFGVCPSLSEDAADAKASPRVLPYRGSAYLRMRP